MAGEPGHSCARGPRCQTEYQGRISGPLMDRIDLRIEVPAVAATGGSIPSDPATWGWLLAVYGTAQLAGAIPIIPGGAGQVEAALVVGLTATGTDASTALAASVAFRLMSHWLVVPIGWVCVAALRRQGADVPRRPTAA